MADVPDGRPRTACSSSSSTTAASTPPSSPRRWRDEPRTGPRRAADRRHDVRLVREPHRAPLNKLDGVSATVNYATEKATVRFDPARRRARGSSSPPSGRRLPRDAALRRADRRPRRAEAEADDDPRRLRRRLHRLRAALAAGPADVDDPARCSSTTGSGSPSQLATPVVLWGAWPFHRAAWANLRHGAATMDTLVALGVARRLAVVAVRAVPRRRGHDRHADALRADPRARRGGDEIYLETAAVVTTFILAGPLLRGPREAPRRRRAEGAARARREGRLGPRRRRRRAPRPGRASCGSATASSSARARRSPPTASSRTAPRPST